MKKLMALILCFVLVSSVALADLSDSEKKYLGSWVMYMANDDTTYLYTLSFFDDNNVTLKTMMFDGSTLTKDNKSSGQWVGFTQDTIMVSFGKNTFVGGINDDGLFTLLDFKTKDAMGMFAPCPDLSDRLV